MVNASQVLLFVATSLLVILIPGQDMVLVMSRGMTQGARAGMVTAGGVSVGLLGHTLLAVLGLGAILSSSALAFSILKYLGAAYLAYLGVKLIVSRVGNVEIENRRRKRLQSLFAEGVLSNLSNPKITIFYFAFLPQFVSVDVPNPTHYLFAMGVTFALLTFALKAPIGVFAGFASAWIGAKPAVVGLINRVSGTVLIGLGVRLALEQR